MKMLKKIYRKIFRRSAQNTYGISETSKCRERLSKYCIGYGLDLGFGGDPINNQCIRIDLDQPYAALGKYPTQLAGDTQKLYWFNDGVLDYIYSSHLLEDFDNTEEVLIEWLRVLKTGGRMIIFCPDEAIYRQHCKKTGQPYNTAHKHAHFSLEFVKDLFEKINKTTVIYENKLVDVYSWELVVEKK